MKAKSSLTFFFAVGAFAAFASPAGADSVAVFYSGGAGYIGPFSGGAYSLTTGTALSTCISGGCNSVGGDIIDSSITFGGSGAGITASTPNAPFVWFDETPSFGGLGLQTTTGPRGTGDDQIESSGVLHIHFSSPVILTGIVTLFDPAHATFGTDVSCGAVCTISGTPDFKLSLNDSTFNTVLFSTANNTNNLFGGPGGSSDFYFKQDGTGNPEFYISALTYKAVPGPVAGAGLPGLIFACATLLCWMRRRQMAQVVA
jgi:hypothetical protein